MVAKLFEKLPLAPAVRSSALVLPGPIIHKTRTSLPSRATEVTRNEDALLVGSVPTRDSCKLDRPSPSASALASLASNGLKPYCCSKPFSIPSASWSLFGSSSGWTDCSTELDSLFQIGRASCRERV